MKQPSRFDESPDSTPQHSSAEQHLRESEARFRSLVLATAQAIWTAGPDGRLTSKNPSWEAFTGLTHQESVDFGWLKAVHPEDQQLTLSAWKTAVANTASYSIEHRLQRHDGQWRYMLTRAVPVFDEQGQVREWIGANTDITERKRAEFRGAVFSVLGQRLSAARTPRDAARTILDAADQLIGWDGCFLDSYSSEQDVINSVLAMDLMNGLRTEVAPSGDGGEPTATMRRVLAEGAQLILRENPQSQPNSTMRFGDVNRPAASLMFVPIRSSLKVAGFLSIQSYKLHAYSREDLRTLQSLADYCGAALERIQSEEALHASERKYLLLFDRNPSPLIVYDIETLRVLAANEAAIHHYGYSREEFLAMTLKDYRPPEDVPFLVKKMQTMGDGLQLLGPFRHLKKDGSIILVDINSHSLTFEGRKARLVMMTDITERKRAEDNLVRLATAVEQSTDIIIHLDLDGLIEYVNPAFERITGYGREAMVGRHINSLPQDGEAHFEFAHLVGRIAVSGSWSGRFVSRKKDGQKFEADVSIYPIRDEGGKITSYIAVERDVTRETALEEQVRLAQKMEAIGLLAGGVAHDFNNLLQVIMGYTMLARSASEHELGHHLEQVQKAAERATQLTRQLLAFGRRQAMQKTDTDINQLVADHLKMLRRLIGENIEIHFLAGKHLENIFADKGQLEQVLLNLCVNARDAMPNGGQLTLETQNFVIDHSFCEDHPWARAGNFILLTVTDNGMGMDRETLSRIFEPFFTTKPKGRGTGLGLSVVYGIIRQHEGLIHVYSEPGLGTTFKIYIPMAQRVSEMVEQNLHTVPPGGTETILLAEDEPMVRQLAVKTLERVGYRVIAASNGEETCDLFALHAKDVDLLLLDVVMPKLGGKEAYSRINETHPGVPVLFCSGYSGNSLEAGYFQVEGLELLQKPYSSNDLLLKVRELLEKRK
ncbi:PAS domain S-box protein [Pedosphaera parvula]|uniref:histidine kinase n=1 Tax=Pedosphaera parvula (strain Ellin514) TaxID=320771 RepID=B9XGY9_PEDPL|nr:PAS domain S-box protein [Pedosphaera parvula]EEF60910.1 multi-sensor hybrid histidine kinase [Pedosphaera parvula Ellin514]